MYGARACSTTVGIWIELPYSPAGLDKKIMKTFVANICEIFSVLTNSLQVVENAG